VVAALAAPWWSCTGKGVDAAQGVGYPEPASMCRPGQRCRWRVFRRRWRTTGRA